VPFLRLPSFLLKNWPGLLAMFLMGWGVWLLLPGMVITMDDDFWYLRSVVQTIQKGRPWTDEWLTPWGASATSLAAGIYQVTGSFKFAIHLQLAGAAAMAGLGLVLFLKRQGIAAVPSVMAALLVLLAPTVLFMFLMFTGVAVYMACLWWCLWLADRRQWVWFLLPWAVALASRQSALAWLALPGCALLREAWLMRRGSGVSTAVLRLLGVLGVAVAVFLTLKFGMNHTAAQAMIVGRLGGELLREHHLMPLMLGGLFWLAGMGMASLLRLPRALVKGSAPAWPRWVAAVLLAAAGAFGARFFQQHSQNTHTCYSDAFSLWCFPLLGAVLGAALGLAGQRPRVDASLVALGSVLLVALYGGRFDYYYYDALCCGIAAGFPFLRQSHPEPAPSHPAGRRVFALTAVIAMGWHQRSAVRLASDQEYHAAVVTLYEKAIRSGALPPGRVGMASFGYLGWLFQDYYNKHEGSRNPVLGGFCRYAQSWDNYKGTGIVTVLPKSLKPLRGLIPTHNPASLRKAEDVTDAAVLHRSLPGSDPIEYTLRTSRNPGPVANSYPLDPTQYQHIPFPLTDAEWRGFIQTGGSIQ
jgi:hypothetical protein